VKLGGELDGPGAHLAEGLGEDARQLVGCQTRRELVELGLHEHEAERVFERLGVGVVGEVALADEIGDAADRVVVVAGTAQDRGGSLGVKVVQRAPPTQVAGAPRWIGGPRDHPALEVVRPGRQQQRLACVRPQLHHPCRDELSVQHLLRPGPSSHDDLVRVGCVGRVDGGDRTIEARVRHSTTLGDDADGLRWGAVIPEATPDALRREAAARGLTPTAVAHLTRDALGRIDLESLAPVKALLKRFFSAEPWTDDHDAQLAQLVNDSPGDRDRWWRYGLDDDIALEFGWRDGRFRIELSTDSNTIDSLAETFDGSVVPEATPNPRTIRFVTGPIHDGPSRWYESGEGVDDPRVARLFGEFSDVANILVGPDFVAIGLRHPDRWEQLLASVLRSVTAEFAKAQSPRSHPHAPQGGGRPADTPDEPEERSERRPGALERAWRELGALAPDHPRLVAAQTSHDAAERQVAARALVDADPEVALRAWERLLTDPSRSVRRATLDAMVDAVSDAVGGADRSALRPLLERAVRDTDAWTRWKALRGLVDLGVGPSRSLVALLMQDPDFRVRLEATSALRT